MRSDLNAIALIIGAIISCQTITGSTRAETNLPACFEAPNQECLLQTAHDAAMAISDPTERAIAIATLASREALIGELGEARHLFTDALTTSKTIALPEARLAALTFIAGEQAQSGLHRDALQTLADARTLVETQIATVDASKVDPWRYRQRELETQQAKLDARITAANRQRQASAAAAMIEDPFERFAERMLAASGQVEAGDIVGAGETLAIAASDAAELNDPEQQLVAWLEIGRLWLRVDRRVNARSAADHALATFRELGNAGKIANRTAALALFMLELTGN